MRLVLLVVTLALFARVVFLMWKGYSAAAGGSQWERWLAAGRHSASVLWANFITVVGALLAGVAGLADLAGAPGISTAIQQYMDPQWVGIGMIAIAVVIEVARRRTLT